MAKDRAQRRHDEEKKYTKRLKRELAFGNKIQDDKGKTITKPTVKDLKEIKNLKDKKNHPKSCSCTICKKERYKRPVQKLIDNDEFEVELEDERKLLDDMMEDDIYDNDDSLGNMYDYE